MGKATGTGQRLTSKARFAATSSVASEVRNLAQRSAAAVKGIKALITASVNEVGAGEKLVADAGATMN